MAKPFMIRFPFKGKGCYANVYTHNNSLREYHVHIIEPDSHPGLPSRIVLLNVNESLHLSEPLNLAKPVLQMIVEQIEQKEK